MKTEKYDVSVRKEFKAGETFKGVEGIADGTAVTADITKTVKVSEVSVPVYDTLSEAVAAEGEQRVLERFNAQNKTDKMNDERQRFTGKPSKSVLEADAVQKFTPEDWDKVRQNSAEFITIREKYVEAAMAEWEAKRGVVAA
jgi:hypothetical protein